jgi:hypothetical protein
LKIYNFGFASVSFRKTYFRYQKPFCVPLKQSIFPLYFLLLMVVTLPVQLSAQSGSDSAGNHSPLSNRSRQWLVAGAHAGIWAGTYIALNKAWYADYPRSGFHFFNDDAEWNQMDKGGHTWTAYQLARVSAATWKWAGLTDRKAVWLGGASALAYQGIIEIQDGFSAEWGFSWGDMAANLAGASAYVAQELGWKEQRIQIKLGYWPRNYPGNLETRRDALFGSGNIERILKDYNSQTYWISVNLHSFWRESRIPRWLNLSLGYGSDLMLGARENRWFDSEGNYFDRTDLPRLRRYYLSFDLDLTQIPTRSRFLQSVFATLNAIKIPAPALQYSSNGRLKFYGIHP